MRRGRLGVSVVALTLAGTATLAVAGNASAATHSRLSVLPFVRVHQIGRSTVSSTNWSGYAAIDNTFSNVKGTWVQPTATCSALKNTYAAFWVGLDGYNSSSVEQLGTDSDCSSGKAKYYAWYEMYPAASVQTSLSVEPGDTLTASVSVSGNSYTLTITDSRSGTFTTTQTASGDADSSAEWIAESPSICTVVCRNASLTNFGTVNFTGASATAGSLTGPISDFTNNEIVMTSNTGTVRAQPSALTAGGSAFSDVWKHS
jgi:Peptidase A4 family